ncbi:MAG: TRAP transporter substrate-binding protein [Oscillospiraceae bacterium]|nr:TRAP transporter substrate-binding protein [Oscillospiraceae bacterium]
MKKALALIAALILLLSMAACAGSKEDTQTVGSDAYADLKPLELVGADSTGKGAAGQIFGEYVASRVAEITGGKLTIDYHPNGELGGDADLIRQMQSNDIQLVVCQTAPIVSFIPEMAVFDLPMVFSKYSGDTIDKVLNGKNDFSTSLSSAYDKADLHLLGFLQNATYRLTTAKRDLSSLADFKGLQIRTMDNKNHMAFWQAIGAEPTPLAWAELYIALQNGTVDAQENAADTCVGASFQEVQDYLACTNHILYCNQICMSKDAWESLDPAYQAAIEQAVADAIAYMRPQLEQIDKDNKKILEDGGMTVIEYGADFFDEILALPAVQAVYDDINDNQISGLGTLLVNELSK